MPSGIVCDDLVDFSDVMPTLSAISGAALPNVTLDGRSFWPQCLGEKGSPRQWLFQYYYPKLADAAEKHGEGVNGREVIWAQNQHFKLYRDGTLYAVADRDEATPIRPGDGNSAAEDARIVVAARHTDSPGFNPVGHPYLGKKLTLLTSYGYAAPGQRWDRRRSIGLTLELLKSGRLDVEPMITHRIKAASLPDMYRRLDEGEPSVVGVVVQW